MIIIFHLGGSSGINAMEVRAFRIVKLHSAVSMIAFGFAAFEEAVYDEKKKNMDVRLDDGEMNVDSLDSTEYSTESIQDDIMYIAA